MPVLLDNINNKAAVQAASKAYTPKYFHKTELTGSGGKRGLLNDMANPFHIKANAPMYGPTYYKPDVRKCHYTNGNAEIRQFPFYILSQAAWQHIKQSEHPDITDMFFLGEKKAKQKTVRAYVSMDVHSATIEHNKNSFSTTNKSGDKKLIIWYQPFFWLIADDSTQVCNHLKSTAQLVQNCVNNPGNFVHTDFVVNPRAALNDFVAELRNDSYTLDKDIVDQYLTKYSLYDGICKRAEQWNTCADTILETLFWQVDKNSKDALNEVALTLRHIETYNIQLDTYRKIYNLLSTYFTDNVKEVLAKQNLNLLLVDTLSHLHNNKSQLISLPTPATQPQLNPMYSKEQYAAITTKEPLALVQAGAGTGKSTVILARIDYMIACGVDPKDITVLSFTNAAADHISELNPKIGSMTIASMIHTIYSANFDHELSTIDTIINALDIYFPDDQIAKTFRGRLENIRKKEQNCYTKINNFIETYYDDVIRMLDTIKQTSLELEIVICYQRIGQLTEPTEIQSKYLIIDEVQDNSIFEFIYAIKYVDKHKESLFIVGDASQTLYEFRASNPKALNMLEGSGVFATYQLQTNYRSNQEILDFANIVLRDIEANQYANIQLRANSLSKVTKQSFTDKVKLDYQQYSKKQDGEMYIRAAFAGDLKSYIQDKLAKKEQVAFLAHSRHHVNVMAEMLTSLWPQHSCVDITSKRLYPQTLFSNFIRHYWMYVKFIPGSPITATIQQAVLDNLDLLLGKYSNDYKRQQAKDFLNKWLDENRQLILAWQNLVDVGKMPLDVFLDNIRDNMLQFEVKTNAMKQTIISMKNAENKESQAASNANFIVSTVHGAKGLEFDNVVVLYISDSDMSEENKRMYYVALTRAMKSEYILAFDKVKTPKIQADYEFICTELEKRDKQAAGNAPGKASA